MPDPSPPQFPGNFTWTGRYEVPDLGVEVPFSWHGNAGNVQMIAGGEHHLIHFTNLIYDGALYTLTYKWPGIERRPCSPIGPFTLHDLNMALEGSRFVGAETLERNEPLRVNHFRVGVVWEPPPDVIPPIPGVSNLRIPLMAGDIYVDRDDPTRFWQVLQFGIQNLYDPDQDEWIRIDNIETMPAPSSCPTNVQRLRRHPALRGSASHRHVRDHVASRLRRIWSWISPDGSVSPYSSCQCHH